MGMCGVSVCQPSRGCDSILHGALLGACIVACWMLFLPMQVNAHNVQLSRYAKDMDRYVMGMDRYAADMKEERDEALRGRKAAMQELDSTEKERRSAEEALAARTCELTKKQVRPKLPMCALNLP